MGHKSGNYPSAVEQINKLWYIHKINVIQLRGWMSQKMCNKCMSITETVWSQGIQTQNQSAWFCLWEQQKLGKLNNVIFRSELWFPWVGGLGRDKKEEKGHLGCWKGFCFWIWKLVYENTGACSLWNFIKMNTGCMHLLHYGCYLSRRSLLKGRSFCGSYGAKKGRSFPSGCRDGEETQTGWLQDLREETTLIF